MITLTDVFSGTDSYLNLISISNLESQNLFSAIRIFNFVNDPTLALQSIIFFEGVRKNMNVSNSVTIHICPLRSIFGLLFRMADCASYLALLTYSDASA